ncbi:MAG: FHA domain-containing protein, partial [Nocardioides sp.]|uniref:FHA domain-containing protein n=1 Tax=Nocardioides sp. TaxID=35761 RepID=UPI0039E43352
ELTRRPDGPPPAAARPAAPRWVLTPEGGAPFAVERDTLIGRLPDAGLRPGAAVLAVDDPQFTVSKTHAVVTQEPPGLWIEDLDSTHGVVVRRKGDEMRLDPRRPTRLLDGDTVILGAFAISVVAG